MRYNSKQQRREAAAKEFELAAKLASENGMTLRPLAYASSPDDVTQYRIEGPEGAWYKELYPGNQRIYCPDKARQGPFVAMQIGKHWSLLDVVRACIKAVSKEPKTPTPKTAVGITGDAADTRVLLRQILAAISRTEGAEPQSALRDLLTDLRHVADHLKLDFAMATDGSYDVYLEEKSDPEFKFEE